MGGQRPPPLWGGRYSTRTPRPWVKCRLGRSGCRSPRKRRNRRSGSAAISSTDTGSEKSGSGRASSAPRKERTGEHTAEIQSPPQLVCPLFLLKKKKKH